MPSFLVVCLSFCLQANLHICITCIAGRWMSRTSPIKGEMKKTSNIWFQKTHFYCPYHKKPNFVTTPTYLFLCKFYEVNTPINHNVSLCIYCFLFYAFYVQSWLVHAFSCDNFGFSKVIIDKWRATTLKWSSSKCVNGAIWETLSKGTYMLGLNGFFLGKKIS